ncbi:beta-ketoacyl-[acyl-carrier-protein] synthase family protein [Prevotella aurantiaca]|jgi:3-oxoacyl-[acyl-carrier-protein] synthase II|uniref:Beta-ketoacyl synthase chain length factor n=1 Tax=Prevotella aurantiaca TaxID=596085 RepID=A0A930HMD4_9BACT|nr:beta-ketoacyl-[acyl-carrier-protein] synthase family protein [Prevotella aurantiaca]MBF1384348.1 beta-ketoacyl synthase chain length factor [Prevotella aurantiaca]MBF1385797.1 beta-ketoacyl synthase chain length factor [Prevotella aurantiaca]
MNIAITGEGIVSAIGLNKQEVLQSLLKKQSGIGKMKHLQSIHHELAVGEVDLSNEKMKEILGIPASQMMSRTALMGIIAIQQALDDANIIIDDILAQKKRGEHLRIALISGTTVGGMDITELCFDNLNEESDLEFLHHHDCGSSTNFMAQHFGIFTEVTTLSTACSSAANAIMFGARLLKHGYADIVVAGGTEALSRFHLNGFNSLMILDHQQCRPFDNTRAGLNLGEGAAFVVLESDEIALKRGVKPHVYLTGYGNACDAFHQTASSENGEGAYLAMKEALDMAQVNPDEIQYVNAHGTGTPNNDQSESVSLQRLFGKNMPLVSSTKSFTGHTTSASGGIEAVICILAMQNHFVPANIGWKNQMETGITPTLGVENIALKHVLCNSFGFGGNDSSLLFSVQPTVVNTTEGSENEIKILSRVEITSEEELEGIRKYVKPLEVRRMGKIMKSSLLSSMEALAQANIEIPDAIITGTIYGCLEYSELLLEQMKEEGETMLKPTHFMQSTHNTIGSNIAIKTKCHGYNVTYTQGVESLEWAIRDAEMLIKEGKAKTVLVGCHDESTPLFNSLLERDGAEKLPVVHSIAMVLTCGK